MSSVAVGQLCQVWGKKDKQTKNIVDAIRESQNYKRIYQPGWEPCLSSHWWLRALLSSQLWYTVRYFLVQLGPAADRTCFWTEECQNQCWAARTNQWWCIAWSAFKRWRDHNQLMQHIVNNVKSFNWTMGFKSVKWVVISISRKTQTTIRRFMNVRLYRTNYLVSEKSQDFCTFSKRLAENHVSFVTPPHEAEHYSNFKSSFHQNTIRKWSFQFGFNLKLNYEIIKEEIRKSHKPEESKPYWIPLNLTFVLFPGVIFFLVVFHDK